MAQQQNRNNKKKFKGKPQKNNRVSNAVKREEVKKITYSDTLTVGQLAELMHKKSSDIIKFLFMMGFSKQQTTEEEQKKFSILGLFGK